MSKEKRYHQEISLHGVPMRLVASTYPWHPILSLARRGGTTLRLITHTLPELIWLAEQFPGITLAGVSLIADAHYQPQARLLKQAYPRLSITTHAKVHTKIALIAPDRVYLSSGNIGSCGNHDTTAELTSRVLHDWYLENVWLPLWLEGKEEEVALLKVAQP